jgi:ADP-heptose:LPS heptosyltransferase
MSYNFDCRFFTGYKPCAHKRPCSNCPFYEVAPQRIAVLSLEAMGAVLRATCLLPAILRRYPKAHITWITLPQCQPLLAENPLIHRTIAVHANTAALLRHLKFDVLYAVDKSLEAGALAEQIQAIEKYGFGLSVLGAIRPFNESADYQFQLGLDDNLKFYQNSKPETQQLTETMGLEWRRDPYVLELTAAERKTVAGYRRSLPGAKVIGYNTGCSILYPYKKLTVSRSIELVAAWRREFPEYSVLLLGGPEDTERQAQIKAAFISDTFVVNSPTREGLRSGILWMDAADLVFSGCSLGMHIAIGLGKPVIAWFGVSCAQEIDLYDKGIKIQSPVTCAPCWRKSCDQEKKCFEEVSVGSCIDATKELSRQIRNV